jgi:hypothetical protein
MSNELRQKLARKGLHSHISKSRYGAPELFEVGGRERATATVLEVVGRILGWVLISPLSM